MFSLESSHYIYRWKNILINIYKLVQNPKEKRKTLPRELSSSEQTLRYKRFQGNIMTIKSCTKQHEDEK